METIEAAWRSLVKRSHPDAHPQEPDERIKRLNVARDWLADPVKRHLYDESQVSARTEASPSKETTPSRAPGESAVVRPMPDPSARYIVRKSADLVAGVLAEVLDDDLGLLGEVVGCSETKRAMERRAMRMSDSGS